MGATRRSSRGFTLIELLVALTVMAVVALLSWRGIDGIVRAQTSMRERMVELVSLQVGLTQWTADLDSIAETGLVSGVDFDGTVLRLTRRDTSSEGSPLRVVGWARRGVDGAQGNGNWARWQSMPIRTRSELQESWAQAQRWAQAPGVEPGQREVTLTRLDQWQLFYYRNNAWSNPMSAADSVSVNPAGNPLGRPGPAIAPLPDAIRLVLSLSAGQALSGVLTKDWIRPVLGGGKS